MIPSRILLFALPGCSFVSRQDVRERLDPDRDGVLWPDDCDGQDPTIGARRTWRLDRDGDGFGGRQRRKACHVRAGMVEPGGDCDDEDAAVHPDASETCDEVDNNCDDLVDEGLRQEYYPDADGDLFGDDRSAPVESCRAPEGHVSNNRDCDDAREDVNPAATEICNDGLDDDCDLLADDADSSLDPLTSGAWFLDADGDGFGDGASPVVACTRPEGTLVDGTDCDDSTALASPGIEAETCGDGLDNDCDGQNGFESGCGLAAELSLGEAGATLSSTGTDQHVGIAVTGIADLDGDGRGDLLIGASGFDRAGPDAGAAYVVSGSVSGALSLDYAVLTLHGESGGDLAGSAVASMAGSAGGAPDLLVGAPLAEGGDLSSGSVYRVEPVAGSLGLESAEAVLLGEARNDRFGAALSAGGDFNGDGTPDLVVGAPQASIGGTLGGAVYVALGPLTGEVEAPLGSLRWAGESDHDGAGTAVASCMDVNGDGLSDILVGVPGSDAEALDAGAAYLLLGPASGSGLLAGAEARFTGEAASDRAGAAVAGAGDVDGDGYGDLAIGAFRSDAGGTGGDHGAVYVLLGPSTVSHSLREAFAVLIGNQPYAEAGASLSGGGDLDRDGRGDLVIGAPGTVLTDSNAGQAYLALAPFGGQVSLGDAGPTLRGIAASDHAGTAVAWVPDTDGDGTADVLIGAPGVGAGTYDNGAAFLVRTGPGL